MFVKAIGKVLDFVIALILVSMEVSSAIAMAMLAYIFATMFDITTFQVMMFTLSEVLLGLLMCLIIYLLRGL